MSDLVKKKKCLLNSSKIGGKDRQKNSKQIGRWISEDPDKPRKNRWAVAVRPRGLNDILTQIGRSELVIQ